MMAAYAIAMPIKYAYSGVVTEVRDYTGRSEVGSYASTGDRFSGSFFYDAGAQFAYLIEPNRGFFVGPADGHTVSVNGITVTGSSGEVQLFDEYAGYPDNLFLASTQRAQDSLPTPLRGYVSVIRLNFLQEIENMTLPSSLSLDASPYPWFSVTGYSADAPGPGNFSWGVHGYVDSLSVSSVPEPNTGLLVVLAVITAVAVGSHGRSARRWSSGAAI